MLFYSFVLSVPQCRSIQIVWSACYTWCYRITIQKQNFAVQYSMYLNVCCAININVYNIFYNTKEGDLIVWYGMTKGTFREKCSLRNVLFQWAVCLSFPYLHWRALKKGSLWRDAPCTLTNIVYSMPEEKHNHVILVDVKFSYPPLLVVLWFF